MIATSDLKTAINKATPMLESLQRLYQRLPQTRCQCEQPGVCCAFLPEMTWIEAVQWTGLLQEMPANARTKILQKFLEFYLTNPIRPAGCPFLENGACGIYELRPFACRAYGLWSPEFGKVSEKHYCKCGKNLGWSFPRRRWNLRSIIVVRFVALLKNQYLTTSLWIFCRRYTDSIKP
jgi:Fe-S-cluster containining protein